MQIDAHKPTVAIVGAGEIGSAIANAIGSRASVRLWDVDASKVAVPMSPLAETVRAAQFVFFCVPSRALRQAAVSARSDMRRDAVVIALAKGLEERTQKTIDQVLRDVFPKKQPIAFLGGPLLAEEIQKGLSSVGVLATRSRRAFGSVAALFADSCVRLEYARDPRDVAVASVLKNVYAVAFGIAEGLGWGWNAKGWLAASSLAEMRRIAPRLGASARAIDGTAGAGDFLATALSPASKNRRAGHEIAKTGRCESPGEGCRSPGLVLKRLGANGKRFPILGALERILDHGASAHAAFQTLIVPPEARHPKRR